MIQQGKRLIRAASRYLIAGAGAVLLAMACGCVDKRVNFDSYSRIQVGMPMEEVVKMVGDPAKRDHEHYYFEGEYGSIKIKEKQGRVDEKDWKDKH